MIIGVTGFKRSGKDTTAEILVEDFGFTRSGLADLLYRMVYVLNPPITCHRSLASLVDEYGWEIAKTAFPEIRRILQYMGTDVVRNHLGPNTWIDAWRDALPPEPRRVVCPDVRFLNEADCIRSLNGTIWRVLRPGTASDGHASESEQLDIECDAVLNNSTTIDDLRGQVGRHMNSIRLAV